MRMQRFLAQGGGTLESDETEHGHHQTGADLLGRIARRIQGRQIGMGSAMVQHHQAEPQHGQHREAFGGEHG